MTAQEDVRDFTRALTRLAVVQFVVTFLALGVSWRAANAAMKSANVADQSLRLTQRATLAIGGWQLEGLQNGAQLARIVFTSENKGHVTGTLQERSSSKCVVRLSELPERPVYENREVLTAPIAPGQALNHELLPDPLLTSSELGLIDTPETGPDRHCLWIYGYVKYLDGFKVARTVGFCVRYESGQLRLAGPPAYNYSD